MPSFNNPAGRLYLLLEHHREILRSLRVRVVPSFEQHNSPLDEAWATLFGWGSAFEARLHMLELVSITKIELGALPDEDQRVFLTPFRNIQMAISYADMGYHVSGGVMGDPYRTGSTEYKELIDAVLDLLDDSVMNGLWHADRVLSAQRGNTPEVELDPAVILELIESVNALRSDMAQSDIPSRLMQMLNYHLSNLANALRYYRVYGNDGVYRAAAAAAGSVAVNQWQHGQEEAKDSPAATYKRSAVDIFAKALSMTSDAMQIAQIAGPKIQQAIMQLQSGF